MKSIVYVGQRVIARSGAVYVVAFIDGAGQVWAFGSSAMPEPIDVICDAWGGESALDLIDNVRPSAVSPRPAPAAGPGARPTTRASLSLAA